MDLLKVLNQDLMKQNIYLAHECVISGPKPCSWAITDEELTALGFPVEKKEMIVHTWTIVVEGKSRENAQYDAWCAGKIRLCSRH